MNAHQRRVMCRAMWPVRAYPINDIQEPHCFVPFLEWEKAAKDAISANKIVETIPYTAAAKMWKEQGISFKPLAAEKVAA